MIACLCEVLIQKFKITCYICKVFASELKHRSVCCELRNDDAWCCCFYGPLPVDLQTCLMSETV